MPWTVNPDHGYLERFTTAGSIGALTNIDVDLATPPGTDPVVPNASDNISFTGAQVASGTVGANVLRSHSLAASSVTYEIQQSGSSAAQNTTLNGVAHFNSSHFSVINGFVSLAGGGQGIDSFTTDLNGPVSPDGSGNIAFTGSTNIFSNGSVANTMRLELQGTNHAIFVGRGANTASTSLTLGTNNTALLGVTGGDPTWGQVPNATLQNSTITLNNGNNITVTGSPISLGGAASIALTGTTNHSVQVGNASGSLTSLSVGTNGQVLIGATGADPAFATLTSSDGSITFTPGANSLSLQVAGGTTVGKTITGDSGGALSPTGGNWNIFGGPGITTSGSGSTLTINGVNFTDNSGVFSASVDNGYFLTAASTVTLPAAPSQGEVVRIIVDTTGSCVITANTGQVIRINNDVSSTAGTATNSARGDALWLVYRTTGAAWIAENSMGLWTLA